MLLWGMSHAVYDGKDDWTNLMIHLLYFGNGAKNCDTKELRSS